MISSVAFISLPETPILHFSNYRALSLSVYCHADIGEYRYSPQEGTECFKITLACSSSCNRDGKETYAQSSQAP